MSNRIRNYAANIGFDVVGKLVRHPEKELFESPYGDLVRTKSRFYLDSALNEYWVRGESVCIVTPDGSIF